MPSRRHPSASVLVTVAAALALAACSRGEAPVRTAARAAPTAAPGAAIASPHPVVRYVVDAPEGARTRLDDPLVGGLVEVEVGRAYTSATASPCKRFNTTAVAGERTVRTWAVCRGGRGDWDLVTAGAAPLAGR